MTAQDFAEFMSYMFGAWVMGWCVGFLIHFVKTIMEKV